MNPIDNKLKRCLAAALLVLVTAMLSGPVAEEKREPLIVRVATNKAIVNWDSWSTANEPLVVKADSDEAIIFFNFKQLPENLKALKITSNAAVYARTPKGLVPLTKKAKANPNPGIDPGDRG